MKNGRDIVARVTSNTKPNSADWRALCHALDALPDNDVVRLLPELEAALDPWNTRLRSLPLGWHSNNPRVTLVRHLAIGRDDTIERFLELPARIQSLSVSERVDDNGEALQRLLRAPLVQSLEHLAVWRSTVAPQALSALKHVPLKWLALKSSGITPTHLEPITQWPTQPPLIHLELSLNPIGNNGLEHLLNALCLEELRHLGLCATQLTNAGLERLCQSPLLSHLKVLDINNNHFDARGIEVLANAPFTAHLETLHVIAQKEPLAPVAYEALSNSPHLAKSIRGFWRAKFVEPCLWSSGRRLPAEHPGRELMRYEALFELSDTQRSTAENLTPTSLSQATQLLAEISAETFSKEQTATHPHVLERDAALAAFVRNHPGELERWTLEHWQTLPNPYIFFRIAPDADGVLASNGDTRTSLGRTLSAWNPEAGCALCAEHWALWKAYEPTSYTLADPDDDGDDEDDEDEDDSPPGLHLAAFFARQSHVQVIETMTRMAPESRDVARWLTTGDIATSFRVLFDKHAWQLTPAEIEAQIEAYTGWSRAFIHEYLRSHGDGLALSRAGFLAPHQTLGEVIAADLKQLYDRGISHLELSQRLQACVLEGRNQAYHTADAVRPDPEKIAAHHASMARLFGWKENTPRPWKAMFHGYMGHQEHPFHRLNDMSYDMLNCGGGDVSLFDRERNTIFGYSDLLPELIRRFAFFEGPGLFYRIEPLEAARMMGW